jgi:hypothetical protein
VGTGALRRRVATVPIEARMIIAMAAVCCIESRWLRRANPNSAAIAGSTLIRTPNVRTGKRVSAAISNG